MKRFLYLILLWISVSSCLTLRSSDSKLQTAFAPSVTRYTPKIHRYEIEKRPMRYME